MRMNEKPQPKANCAYVGATRCFSAVGTSECRLSLEMPDRSPVTA